MDKLSHSYRIFKKYLIAEYNLLVLDQELHWYSEAFLHFRFKSLCISLGHNNVFEWPKGKDPLFNDMLYLYNCAWTWKSMTWWSCKVFPVVSLLYIYITQHTWKGERTRNVHTTHLQDFKANNFYTGLMLNVNTRELNFGGLSCFNDCLYCNFSVFKWALLCFRQKSQWTRDKFVDCFLMPLNFLALFSKKMGEICIDMVFILNGLPLKTIASTVVFSLSQTK